MLTYEKQIRNASLLIREGVSQLPTATPAPEYSIIRAINDLVDNNGKVGNLATPEARASRIEADRLGMPPNPGCLYVPLTRDATVAGTGSYLVGSTVAPGDVFISALRANSVATALGVPEIHVDNYNVALPSVAGDITTYWLSSESATVTEGSLTFGQVATVPKTVGAYIEISDRLLKQTSAAGEAFILREVGKAVAAAVDVALINGSGVSGEPSGILQASIGSEAGGSLTWALTASAINDVEVAGGLVNEASGGWAIAPDAAEIMRARAKATGLGFILDGGLIDGRKAVISGSVPAGTAIFGDWSQVVIASWGGLEIGIAKATAGSALFKTGIVGVRVLYTLDVMVLNAASFSKIGSIT